MTILGEGGLILRLEIFIQVKDTLGKPVLESSQLAD